MWATPKRIAAWAQSSTVSKRQFEAVRKQCKNYSAKRGQVIAVLNELSDLLRAKVEKSSDAEAGLAR